MGVLRQKLNIHVDSLDRIYRNAVEGGCNYLRDHPKVKSLVLGLSGGIDSLVTALLADAVVDKMNDDTVGRPYRFFGYSLPIITNEAEEIQRAKDAGMLFCHHFSEVDLSRAFMDTLPHIDNSLYYALYGHDSNPTHEERIRGGNLKARLRMAFLYDKASKYNGMVLSTDNQTEYLLGFWTLHGDVGDFGFIQELWKTEVYALAEHIGFISGSPSVENIVTETCGAKPTDGLGVSDSDLDQLLPGWEGGYRQGYRKVDEALIEWINNDHSYAFCDEFDIEKAGPILQRYFRTEFKRKNPLNLDRWFLEGLIGYYHKSNPH